MDIKSTEMSKPQRKHGRKQRVPLSCEPCRSRKLKCNREQPCQNCSVRDNRKGCIYLGPEGGPASNSTLKPAQAEGMQSRIDRLEALVTALVAQGQDPSGNATSYANSGSSEVSSSELDSSAFRAPSAPERHTPPYDEIEHGVGVMKVDGKASMYKGTTHWYDVLQELNEIKSFWSEVQENPGLSLEPSYSDAIDGPSLFFGVSQPGSLPEMLASLPARPAAEKLLSRFFDNEEGPAPTFHILHKPTFMREYHDHLAAPDKTPIMWLGLYSAVLSQIMLSYHLNGDEPPEYEGISASLSQMYRVRAAQCLAMGDMSTCKPYTLETLVYNIMCEWARSGQGNARVWMMVGLLVRVAFQMGYHRDPSQYPEISVFQGEMRRRVWSFIHRTDGLTSFLVGHPTMIRERSHDTQPPSNLYDWELAEDMTELPPSRPMTEPTPVSYLIVKGNILFVMGRIVNFLTDLGQYPYDNVLALDSELEKVFNNVPTFFRLRGFDDVDTESPSLVNRRIQLDFLYHQGMCVLHRKFFSQGRLDARFERSYKRCTESALALLAQQHFLYSQAHKGSLIARHWYRVSYTSHDFILAAMILVLDIRHRRSEATTRDVGIDCTVDSEAIDALQNACIIWKQESEKKTSAEAVKVYQVLSNMLNSIGVGEKVEVPQPEQAVPGPGLEPDQAYIYNAQNFAVPAIDMEIDWDIWDSFVEGTSFEDAYGGFPQNLELLQ